MKKIAPIVAIALGVMFTTSCKKKNTCVCKTSAGVELFSLDMSSVKGVKSAACSAYDATYSSQGGSCKLQ